MKALDPGLVLLLVCVSSGLGHACTADGQTLICLEVPSTFSPGYLSLVMLLKDVGEINSSALHSDSLVSVSRLTINGANITGIVPGAFASLRNLQNLSLNQNALTQIDPNWFGEPAVLRDLSLTENHIEVLEESMLRGLIGLARLNLAKNRIRAIDPGSFSFQTGLVELDLSGNRMTRVAPQVFRSLSSTRIRLDGNPWDCSCGVEDFVDFLKDLQNRSLLEREMDVTCKTPVTLSGEPVWNVSVCATTPPSRPPPETTPPSRPPPEATPPSRPPPETTPPSRPPPETTPPSRPPPETTPPSGPPPETETPVHPEPTDTPITVPTLIGVIVALCVLLCVVCFLAVLHRRKRERKTVMPGPPREEREKSEEDSGARHPTSPEHAEKRDLTETFHWDTEVAWRSPVTGVRAKSANAVLSTSPFCAAVKDQLGLQTKTEGPSEDTKNSAEGNQKVEKETEEVGRSQTEKSNLANETIEEEEKHGGSGRQQNADKNTVNAETVPYFSIGTDQYKLNPELNKGQYPDGRGQRSQMGKVMGRISTWPPTSVQWQARCSIKAREEEGPALFRLPSTMIVPNAPLEFKTETEECQSEMEAVVSKMEKLSGNDALEGGDQTAILGDTPEETHMPDLLTASPTQDPDPLQMKELLLESTRSQSRLVTSDTDRQEIFTATEVVCSKPNDETAESSSYHVITSCSPFCEAQTPSQTDPSQDEELSHDPEEITHQDPDSAGQIGEEQTELKNLNRAQLGQNQDPEPEGTRHIRESPANQNATTKTNKKAESINEPKRAQTRESHSSSSSSQSGEQRNPGGSKAPSAGASPGDESLLCSNEYAYIDLLHEVVQNHGRWTRERWRQTHLNKQRCKPQGQEH